MTFVLIFLTFFTAVHRWDLAGREGGMTTAGVGGPITGKGAHLFIIDDPVKNDEMARSAFQRQKQWDWWQSTASTRMRPLGLAVVIQTRWHRDDLAGRILQEAARNGQRWRELKLPAVAEDRDPLGRAPGEPLWPEVYSKAHLERVRDHQTGYIETPIAEARRTPSAESRLAPQFAHQIPPGGRDLLARIASRLREFGRCARKLIVFGRARPPSRANALS